MKRTLPFKNLFIVCAILLFAFFKTNAQITVNIQPNGDFENWTENLPDSWIGNTTNIPLSGVNEYSEAALAGTKSCQLIRTGGTHARFSTKPLSILADTEYTVTYYARGKGEIRNAFFRNGAYSGYSDYTVLDTDDWTEIVWTFEFGTAVDDVEVVFSVRNTDESRGHLQIDNVSITYEAIDENKVLAPTFSPTPGTIFEPTEVAISTSTADADVYYKTTEEGDWVLYENAIMVSEATTIWAYAEKEDMENSDVVSASYQFPIEVASIADLRLAERNNSYYTITGEVVITYFTENNRNQVYIQDKGGVEGLLLDDNSGNITTEYDLYDGVSNLTGQITGFRNMMQFVPALDPGDATSSNNEVTPQTVTIEALKTEFTNDSAHYQGRLVRIETVKIVAEETEFSQGNTYELHDYYNNALIMRTPYPDKDYFGEAIPNTWQNLAGLILQEDNNVIFIPRSLSDMEVSPENENIATTPVIDPNGGNYIMPVNVTMTTETEDGVIWYNFTAADAEESEWMEYTDAITVSETTTIWAITKKDGLTDSPVTKAEFVFPDPMVVPYITKFSVAENWDLVTTAGAYGQKLYEEDGWHFTAENTTRDGTAEAYDGSNYVFRNRGDLTITNQLPIENLGGFRLWLRDWRATPKADREIHISMDGGENFMLAGIIDANWAEDNDTYFPFTYYFPEGAHNFIPEELVIEVKGTTLTLAADANPFRIRVGGFEALEESNIVVNPAFSPNGGEYFDDVEVSIVTTTAEAQVHYKTSVEDDWLPYLNVLTISETTTLWAYSSKDGMENSEVVTATFTFPEIIEVADIETLRAGEMDGTIYRLTGEAVMTFAVANRNQKFIQDATGAILIDDAPGIITTQYDLYDGIENIIGTLSAYEGMLQFVPVINSSEASSKDNQLTPVFLSINDFDAIHQAHLVTITNVTIDPGEDEDFSGFKTYSISDASGTGLLRVFSNDLDFAGSPIPLTPQDITGVLHQTEEGIRLTPRYSADFAPTATVNIPEEKFGELSLFPIPVLDVLSIKAIKTINSVEIYNTVGSLVSTTTVNNTTSNVNMSNSPSGLYFIKVNYADGSIEVERVIKK